MVKNTMRLIVLLLFVLILGCQDKDRFESIQTLAPLMDGIASYQSLDDFKVGRGAAYVLEVTHDGSDDFSGSNTRPPFKFETVVVRDFEHLGHRGSLEVTFFNGRLAQTFFFPKNFDQYLEVLSFQTGSDVTVLDLDHLQGSYGESMLIQPHVRLFAAKDFEGNSYVCWEDERLIEEINLWIATYA